MILVMENFGGFCILDPKKMINEPFTMTLEASKLEIIIRKMK